MYEYNLLWIVTILFLFDTISSHYTTIGILGLVAWL